MTIARISYHKTNLALLANWYVAACDFVHPKWTMVAVKFYHWAMIIKYAEDYRMGLEWAIKQQKQYDICIYTYDA